MLKSELTQAQLTMRTQFVQALVSAAWDPRGIEQLFERNTISLTPEATLEYNKENYALRFGYFIGNNYLQLDVGTNPEFFRYGLRCYIKDNILEIVEKVISIQDDINIQDWHELVEILRPLCPQLILVNEDGETTV